MDYRKRRGYKKELFRVVLGTAGVLALALVTFGAARATWDMYGKFTAASDARQAAAAQQHALEAQLLQVEDEVASLSDPRGIEREVRERYGVARPGEGEIRIVREAATSSFAEDDSSHFLRRVWEALFVW